MLHVTFDSVIIDDADVFVDGGRVGCVFVVVLCVSVACAVMICASICVSINVVVVVIAVDYD